MWVLEAPSAGAAPCVGLGLPPCPLDLGCGQGVGALLRTRWSSPGWPAVCPAQAVCLLQQYLVGTEQGHLLSCQASLRSQPGEAQRGSGTWPRSHSRSFELSHHQAQKHCQPIPGLHSPSIVPAGGFIIDLPHLFGFTLAGILSACAHTHTHTTPSVTQVTPTHPMSCLCSDAGIGGRGRVRAAGPGPRRPRLGQSGTIHLEHE